MELKTFKQNLRSSLKGKELDLMLEEIYPGQRARSYAWWAAENQTSLPHSRRAQAALERVQLEKESQDPRAKEVQISQGENNHFKSKSLFPIEAGRPKCSNSGCLLTKSFNLWRPSFLICKRRLTTFLNNFTKTFPGLAHPHPLVFLSQWLPWRAFLKQPPPPPSPSHSLSLNPVLFRSQHLCLSDIILCFEPVSSTPLERNYPRAGARPGTSCSLLIPGVQPRAQPVGGAQTTVLSEWRSNKIINMWEKAF